MLAALGIDESSQTLVYSGTSLQASYISAANPRAIYFNDNVSVAWIRGAPLIELAAQDARLGTVFYQLSQTESATPRPSRMETCLSCHLSWDTRAVPGRVRDDDVPAQVRSRLRQRRRQRSPGTRLDAATAAGT